MENFRELYKLPQKGAKTIRFFKKGGSYFTIDDDAEMIASKLLKSSGSLKDSSDGGKYLSVSDNLYASLLRDLLLYKHISIELYEFDDGKWSKTLSASPGNVLPVLDIINADLDFTAQSTTLAVNIVDAADGIKIDAATCDPTLFTIATTDFIEKSSFCYFESLLTQTMPSEIILGKVPDRLHQKAIEVIEKFGITWKTVETIKNVDCGTFPQTKSMKILLSSLCITLSEFSHRSFHLYEFMTVDYAAAIALNLFPEEVSTKSGLPTSIFQLLNACVTPMGSRLLQQYMMQPLLNIDGINKRLDIVAAFSEEHDVRISSRQAMKQLPDIARLMRKFLSGRANLQDCVKLYDVTNVVEKFDTLRESENPQFAEFIEAIDDVAENASKAKNLIEQVIDFDLIPQHIYRVKPMFDPELQDVSEKIDDIKNKMEKKRKKIAENIGVDDEKLKLERTNNGKSYYFRIPRSLERQIRGDSTLTVLEARQNGVHFTCRSLTEFVDEIVELEGSYTVKQREIQKRLIDTLREYDPVFEKLCETFSLIDFYSTLAEVATSNNYVRPTISPDSSDLSLVQARHPLLEKHVNFIPNDVEMKKGESSFIIISGPNSAGKSTLLKTVGCCAFLAHLGSFVPCTEATIPIIPSIHARVGAWDLMNMSTFTVEMTEMASILESASSKSLVIVDELGRSTSCSDGFGLAWSISKKLAVDIGAFTLFATHFHELCNLESEIKCVKNYHMEADTNDCLRMCYTFKKGPFGDSFGIEAAERAGFLPEVMQAARTKVRQLELIDEQKNGAAIPKKEVKDFNRPYKRYIQAIKQYFTGNQSITPEDLVKVLEEAQKTFEDDQKKVRYEAVE
jgi:DNA mismatch repair protein MSH2